MMSILHGKDSGGNAAFAFYAVWEILIAEEKNHWNPMQLIENKSRRPFLIAKNLAPPESPLEFPFWNRPIRRPNFPSPRVPRAW